MSQLQKKRKDGEPEEGQGINLATKKKTPKAGELLDDLDQLLAEAEEAL